MRSHPLARESNRLLLPLACCCFVCIAFSFAVGQQSSASEQHKLSRQFTQSATSTMVSLHNVKQNAARILERNLPSGYYDHQLSAQAYENLRAAETNASTQGDQQTAGLLNSYFTKVKSWLEKYK